MGGAECLEPFIAALRAAGPRPSLRHLSIGLIDPLTEEDRNDSCCAPLDLMPLFGFFPGLRVLELRAAPLVLGCLEYPALELPAGAGETSRMIASAFPPWAYPRLARGKLRHQLAARLAAGPIPAGAGETRLLPCRSGRYGAYPRWRGGNSARMKSTF